MSTTVFVTSQHPQTTSMGLQFFHVKYTKTKGRKNALSGEKREIREMLVINRIKLNMAN